MSRERLYQRQRRHRKCTCIVGKVFNPRALEIEWHDGGHQVDCPIEHRNQLIRAKDRLNRQKLKPGGEQIPHRIERRHEKFWITKGKVRMQVTKIINVPVFDEVGFNQKGRI